MAKTKTKKKKLSMPMVAKYVKGYGLQCLFCGEGPVVGDGLSVDGPVAWGDVQCDNCGETWVDLFKLVGVAESGELYA